MDGGERRRRAVSGAAARLDVHVVVRREIISAGTAGCVGWQSLGEQGRLYGAFCRADSWWSFKVVISAVLSDRGNAPHPAFGQPLPAHAGRGATTQRVPLLPACGEKVP